MLLTPFRLIVAPMTRIVTTAHRYKRPPKKRKAVAIAGPANDLDPAYVEQLREAGIMTDYKQAGDLVPDDLYIRRWGTRDQTYRVITTRPGNAATVVEVIVELTKTGRRSASNFFRSNRVEMVPREPQKGEDAAL
jgi:hypothetical protein